MFRKLSVSLAMALFAISAFAALPKPSEVKDAFASGNYQQAEQMLKQVLDAKPDSAPAHYQLGQVYSAEGKHNQAISEYKTAQRLDSTLKFASSSSAFSATLQKEQNAISAPAQVVQNPPPVNSAYSVVPVPQAAPKPAESSGNGVTIMLVLLVLGVAGFFIYAFISKKNAAKAEADTQTAETKSKMNTLLGFLKQLEESTLISKTASYGDAMRRNILDRIATQQTNIRGAVGDLKDGKTVTASRIVTFETYVNQLVDEAANGTPVAVPKPAVITPAPTPVTAATDTPEWPARNNTSAAPAPFTPPEPMPPAPAPYQATVHNPIYYAPAPVIVQNNNDGLLAGVILGSMMNGGHRDTTVIVERETPRYRRDEYEEAPSRSYSRPAPAPAQLDSSEDDNDSYRSPAPSPAPSWDSGSSSNDSYSSDSGSSGGGGDDY